MGHTVIDCYIHYIFSTKNRVRSITPDIRDRFWAYMGGIAREHNATALEIGGSDDHGHVLLSLPSTLTIAQGVQLIKGGSSKWVNETFSILPRFAWQDGYAAFSVGHASLKNVREYIRRQEEHHRMHTFQEELLAFLTKYNVLYDERYLWD